MQLCDWLSYGDASASAHKKQKQSEEHSDTEVEDEDDVSRFQYYEDHPASQDLLMLLLSVPFVDESWGVHTLILVRFIGG